MKLPNDSTFLDEITESIKIYKFLNKNASGARGSFDSIRRAKDSFFDIPGYPLAYWLSTRIKNIFKNDKLESIAECCTGMQTGNNDKYIRLWFEPNSKELSIFSGCQKYIPYNCGGERCKWYGNNYNVVDGLAFAGGEWNDNKYTSFIPDADNIIPITDEEYFSDDIVGRFVEFVRTVYGDDTLEENLDFIAQALGNKGDTSREVIRNYFIKDFYADHLKVYQKRPIYWLFDSGKQNGFKALIYMHRYDADTVGRVRTDYLHKAQKYVETAMQSAQYTLDNASSSSEKSKATKSITKYTKQLAEMQIYDEAIAHIANQRIAINLDDGVKVNYAKFQGVEVAQEGKKALKVDLLAKI